MCLPIPRLRPHLTLHQFGQFIAPVILGLPKAQILQRMDHPPLGEGQRQIRGVQMVAPEQHEAAASRGDASRAS